MTLYRITSQGAQAEAYRCRSSRPGCSGGGGEGAAGESPKAKPFIDLT